MHAVFISLSALPPRLTETFANAKPISLDRYVYVQCSAGTDNNHHMGNSMGGKRRRARVMTVDGTTYKYRAPAAAGDALREHPGKGNHLLESEEVRRLGLRARPLDPDAPLKPGKLYFLVQIPRGGAGDGDDPRAPRKTWSGALRVGARERLEGLMLSRRTVSDVSSILPPPAAASSPSSVEVGADGAVRLRMRLPKADVARLMQESRDPAEAAERIMQLCVARDQQGVVPALPPSSARMSGNNPAPAPALKKEVSGHARMIPSSPATTTPLIELQLKHNCKLRPPIELVIGNNQLIIIRHTYELQRQRRIAIVQRTVATENQ